MKWCKMDQNDHFSDHLKAIAHPKWQAHWLLMTNLTENSIKNYACKVEWEFSQDTIPCWHWVTPWANLYKAENPGGAHIFKGMLCKALMASFFSSALIQRPFFFEFLSKITNLNSRTPYIGTLIENDKFVKDYK